MRWWGREVVHTAITTPPPHDLTTKCPTGKPPATPAPVWGWCFFFGLLWGLGGLTFGLTMRYLGLSLGMAIVLGLTAAFGTLMPPIFSGQMSSILHETSGQVILAGVGVCMLAIAVSGLAGYSKEHEISSEDRAEAGERDFSFAKGLAVAIFAGEIVERPVTAVLQVVESLGAPD